MTAPKTPRAAKPRAKAKETSTAKLVAAMVPTGGVPVGTSLAVSGSSNSERSDLSPFVTESIARRAGMSLGEATHRIRIRSNPAFYLQRERAQAIADGMLIILGPLHPPRRKPKNLPVSSQRIEQIAARAKEASDLAEAKKQALADNAASHKWYVVGTRAFALGLNLDDLDQRIEAGFDPTAENPTVDPALNGHMIRHGYAAASKSAPASMQ